MDILFLTPDEYDARGGIARYTRDFIDSLCTSRLVGRVCVIPRSAKKPRCRLPEKARYLLPRSTGKLAFISATLASLRGRQSSFGLLICGHINLLPVALLVKMLTGAPVVLLIYGVDAWCRPNATAGLLVRFVTAVVSISRFTMERFLGWAPVDGAARYILHNAIDLSLYGPGPRNPELAARYRIDGRKVLMTMGRLAAEERYKGMDRVIRVLPGLLAEFDDLVFLIAGDGSDRQRLEQMAEELGVRESVVFTGFVKEDEKVRHFQLADAFVMPSTGEGFGFVFVEAMACGIPTVAGRVDGSFEAVGEGRFGIVVDPRLPEQLQAGIAEALRRPSGIVPAGLDEFSLPTFMRKVDALLRDVLEK